MIAAPSKQTIGYKWTMACANGMKSPSSEQSGAMQLDATAQRSGVGHSRRRAPGPERQRQPELQYRRWEYMSPAQFSRHRVDWKDARKSIAAMNNGRADCRVRPVRARGSVLSANLQHARGVGQGAPARQTQASVTPWSTAQGPGNKRVCAGEQAGDIWWGICPPSRPR